jgi:hypothetical protein
MYRNYRLIICLFSRGGSGIECLTGDLVTTQQGGSIMYHRDIKGQRGVAAKHRLRCAIREGAHPRIASMLEVFDAYRLRTTSTGLTPLYRLAIDIRKTNQLVTGHPFGLDASRFHGH